MTRVNTGSLDEAVATVLLLPRSWGGILAEKLVEAVFDARVFRETTFAIDIYCT